MQKISTFLWFDNNLEEAVEFYASVFKNSKIVSISKAPGDGGKAFAATFEIEGQEFLALNGGPGHPFTDAISLFVKCETQEEIDYYWDKLTADGGKAVACGWLKDKYGLSWQIVPNLVMSKLLGAPDRVKAQRVMHALVKMVKLDIAGLQAAYDEE
ncbi:putative 3-demethylubiquinone-9 3-methyltransferase (glyoxalase superfamily) [Mucilaginibacter gracilis]|uniref:Putative 3-demethylubiquinone-9 3-methyltransferase (Glyoxalase superfamily) n=1 Tax=Mucilaginibacter gracilis TaxID=423350 RepID=A0A495IX14_9SPHI|nr:VOC family protein [Mucilaginibacter gracilis]RKR80911.1 putative 3-demethylubiquinone-9 3-methyltransferase (glyoxalase superfamily) [Mucilaginibacter gracilis]